MHINSITTHNQITSKRGEHSLTQAETVTAPAFTGLGQDLTSCKDKVADYVKNFKFPAFGEFAAGIFRRLDKVSSIGQRVAIGTTAVLLQPFIDLKNKRVDDETRTLNASRSIARGIVGTATGVVTRWGFISLVEKYLDQAPRSALEKFVSCGAYQNAKFATKEDLLKVAKSYSKVLGTVLALGVMVVTNFLVDVPLTNALSKKINDNFFNKNKETEAK